jgi:hypothetical protein
MKTRTVDPFRPISSTAFQVEKTVCSKSAFFIFSIQRLKRFWEENFFVNLIISGRWIPFTIEETHSACAAGTVVKKLKTIQVINSSKKYFAFIELSLDSKCCQVIIEVNWN